ncbi:lactate dehydrogenase [Mesorhizobium sp. L-8-10]|uniref:alpha-hydroxy-acid oxidizing protein n=1 Tax=Mesorhizobium sp. L-8-10 TaxID=2744523 RepID=UPI0019271804|nr:alpha-hydroxy-acid oxidizing protein [Mesorhizobium sp. L-8-10]BCH33760.1 lactate dehydrogenase [Mesorhizobium sp. L-8-10]
MTGIFNAHDFQRKARQRLPRMIYDFIEGGAGDESGLDANLAAFRAWQFLPHRLRDVSRRDLTAQLWDRSYSLPIYIAPTGFNGALRPGADAMLARAAARASIPFALSTASSESIEEIARAGDGDKWFQLYVLHREISAAMCCRARDAGYSTLMLTVDVPLNGYRERDMRNGFGLPPRYTPRSIWDGITHPGWSLDYLRHGVPKLKNFETTGTQNAEVQAALMKRRMDASFDWDALAGLRDLWPGKLMVKGILRKDDARRCADLGVDAVILSNHGGRQLDDTVSPVAVLPEIAAELKIPVLIDSGIRRGADVVKSLCLGAGLAGIGRPALYAVAAEGEAGIDRLIAILRDEMDRALAMLGVAALSELEASLMRCV